MLSRSHPFWVNIPMAKGMNINATTKPPKTFSKALGLGMIAMLVLNWSKSWQLT
jgi:hypothetical protein